ncbi:hypothetical protein [Brachybacterium sp. EE-P12]|uniref:hypothetical protein n=1 Tax=Brachybacterium sp. EE-P12 TaxID=2306299 RepID=UPI000F7FE2B2|nr:hypothetical protein [Brachybacterium sp. EE-P12]
MVKKAFEVPVEIDLLGLSIVGWEGEARLRVTADDWETESSSSPKIAYSYALSGAFHFNEEDWNVRYRRSREDSYVPSLLLEIHCPSLGESFYEEIATDELKKVRKRPLRVSKQGRLGYTLPSVDPSEFSARITAFDGLDAETREFCVARKEIPVETVSELDGDAFAPVVDVRAYLVDEYACFVASGSIRIGSREALAEKAAEDDWFDPSDDEEAELPLPDIEVEWVDSTGFVLEEGGAYLGWQYPYRRSTPIAQRPPRFFVKLETRLDDLSGIPTRAVARFVEGED